MTRLARLSSVALCALSACALAAPGALASKHHGASGGGVVLAPAHGGAVRLVDAHHRVSDARVGSTRGLHRGDVVAVRHGHAHVTGHVRTISFYARVVRSSAHGAVVKLADGSSFKLASAGAHGAHASSTLTIDLQGLAPGQAVLITISSDGQGNVALTIKLVSGSTPIGDGEQQASGVVTDDTGGGTFAIATSDGSGLRFADPQRLLEAANAAQCDEVDVTYHRARGHRLVADTLRVSGQSDQGACADQSSQDGNEIDGAVTAIAADDSSLTVDPGDGSAPATIAVDDPTLLDGISVGDQVAVITDDGGVAQEIDLLDISSEDPGDQGDGGDSGDQGDG